MRGRHKVVIYTTPVCVYCRMVKSFLGVRGISYIEKDVSRDMTALDEMRRKSHASAVPVLDTGREILVGFDRDKLKEIFG